MTDAAVDFAGRLAEACDGVRAGAVIVEALRERWGADAALAWLPVRDGEGVHADDVTAAGSFVAAGHGGMLAAIRERRLGAWFAEHALTTLHAVDLPEGTPGVIAAAWRERAAVPAGIDDLLALVAAQIARARDHRRLETQLADARAMQGEADEQIARTRRVRAMGEMASGIVHDFNNALTSILGYAELALGPLKEGDAFHNDLSSIRTAALDAAALVRRLQSLGRKGRERDEREIADLREIARLMPTLARPRWAERAHRDGVSFEIVVDAAPAPPVNVVVAEIRELLLNLLFNAVDAMPNGGRITIGTGTDADGWALLSVADEGIGIPEDLRQHIFQPFFSTKGEAGSGLGLSVSRTIASRHGAQLEVESTQGRGTVFTLHVPPAAAGLSPAVPDREAPIAPAPAEPRRILLVDDQPEVRDSVGDMLRAMGHAVSVADGGAAALQVVARQRIDVLITDLGMPGMNGLVLAQRFRAVAPRIPVVLLTGWGLDADAVCPTNVVFVMGKPVTLRALGDALASCVAEPSAARSALCS